MTGALSPRLPPQRAGRGGSFGLSRQPLGANGSARWALGRGPARARLGGGRRSPARPGPGPASSPKRPNRVAASGSPAPPLPAPGRRTGLGCTQPGSRGQHRRSRLACLAGWLAICGSYARSAEPPAPGRPGRRQPRRAPTCRSSRGATVSATRRVRAGRAPGTATWRPPGRRPGSPSRDHRWAGDGGLGTHTKSGGRPRAPRLPALWPRQAQGWGLEGRWQLVALARRVLRPCTGGVPGPEGILPPCLPSVPRRGTGERVGGGCTRPGVPVRARVAARAGLRQRRGGGIHFPFLCSGALGNPSSLSGPRPLFLEPFTRPLEERPFNFPYCLVTPTPHPAPLWSQEPLRGPTCLFSPVRPCTAPWLAPLSRLGNGAVGQRHQKCHFPE